VSFGAQLECGEFAEPVPCVCVAGVQSCKTAKAEQSKAPPQHSMMPATGPFPLPYDDVLDISMYSAEEISGDTDVLDIFKVLEFEEGNSHLHSSHKRKCK